MKLYRHFAYKFEARPPFAVTAISHELPLSFKASLATRELKSRYIAFVSGLALDAERRAVYVTYGAADIEPRVLVLSLEELEELFGGAEGGQGQAPKFLDRKASGPVGPFKWVRPPPAPGSRAAASRFRVVARRGIAHSQYLNHSRLAAGDSFHSSRVQEHVGASKSEDQNLL